MMHPTQMPSQQIQVSPPALAVLPLSVPPASPLHPPLPALGAARQPVLGGRVESEGCLLIGYDVGRDLNRAK